MAEVNVAKVFQDKLTVLLGTNTPVMMIQVYRPHYYFSLTIGGESSRGERARVGLHQGEVTKLLAITLDRPLSFLDHSLDRLSDSRFGLVDIRERQFLERTSTLDVLKGRIESFEFLIDLLGGFGGRGDRFGFKGFDSFQLSTEIVFDRFEVVPDLLQSIDDLWVLLQTRSIVSEIDGLVLRLESG